MEVGNLDFVKEAFSIQDKLVEFRRYLHENPEIGMELPKTTDFVKKVLSEMGVEAKECGKSGIVANIGGKKPGRTFLLRGDMDALPIIEETELSYKSQNEYMHACGHDFHTSMLLGAAYLLKKVEDSIPGVVKLMFQPGEEIFEGARSMIEGGILENPHVDAAMMIHVRPGVDFESGTVITTNSLEAAAASDWFRINIYGKGGHGAMPEKSIDPLNIASNIFTSLQTINSREVHPSEFVVLTIGEIHGGKAANVIPDSAYMSGTVRTYDKDVRNFVKERMTKIAANIGDAFRAKVEVEFSNGCPSVINNKDLLDGINKMLPEIVGEAMVFNASDQPKLRLERMSGSEDFAFISEEVPSVMLRLATGRSSEGYSYPQHHPKALFDEKALSIGAGLYASIAMKWLGENS